MTLRSIPMKKRQFQLLAKHHFDVLVIGGGITGAGIARDLALRGLRLALVEQHDFASGTSSKSTKLIHGGLRYLEQMAFGLVFESCRERSILQQIAPHLVRPLPLMIPLYHGASRPTALIRAGLMLYDLLALFRNTHWHRILSAGETLRRQPGIDPERLRGSVLYWDCQMDDARLCLENVLAARECGAVTVNYARAIGFTRQNGQITGAVVEDQETKAVAEVRAKCVVNASGPWLDKVCGLAGHSASKLQPTRGSHILVPRVSSAPEALYLSADRDDRMFFVIPWGNLSLIGTTDIDASDPDRDAEVTDAEIDYLLEETGRYLPQLGLGRSDVVDSFAGLRPLLAHDVKHPSKASREHAIFSGPEGLLSIGGGKYTTYRAMAEELADRVMARLGRNGRCLTKKIPLPGGATGPFMRYRDRQLPAMIKCSGLAPDLMSKLLDRYGSRTQHLLEILQKEPDLASPVASGLDLTVLEVVYAKRYEMARTADDVVRRRASQTLGPGQNDTAYQAIESVLRDDR